MASSVLGMLAPSATTLTPFLTRFAASLALISFCVALGKAQSALMFHSGLWSSFRSVGMKIAFLNLSAYSRMRPRRDVLQLHDPGQLLAVDAVGIVDDAVRSRTA